MWTSRQDHGALPHRTSHSWNYHYRPFHGVRKASRSFSGLKFCPNMQITDSLDVLPLPPNTTETTANLQCPSAGITGITAQQRCQSWGRFRTNQHPEELWSLSPWGALRGFWRWAPKYFGRGYKHTLQKWFSRNSWSYGKLMINI